jgi:hypothetical protein
MSGPWEAYQTASNDPPVAEDGPWAKFGAPEKPQAQHDMLDKIGLMGSAAFRGITSLPLAAADASDAANAIAAKLTGRPYEAPSEQIKRLGESALSKAGLRLEQPNTKGERLAQDAVTGAFSTVGGPGSMARNMVSGGMAGLAGGNAREAGAGVGGQMLASLLGGMSPAIAENFLRGIGGIAGNAGAAIGAAYGNQRGINRLASQAIKTEAGADAPRIAAANLAGTEYLPGAKPTVAPSIAQANMGVPEQFGGGGVGLEKNLSGARGLEDVLPSIAKRNKLAMEEPLQLMAGGSTRKAQDAAQEMAKASRAAGAGAQYEALAAKQVANDHTLELLLNSPAGTKAMELARNISKNDNAVLQAAGKPSIPFELTDSKGNVLGYTAKGLQYVKEALDSVSGDKLLQAQLGLSGSALVPVKGIRSGLVSWMNKNIPGWEDARTAYAKQSGPLNRLQVGQEGLNKLQNEQGTLTPTSFMNVIGRNEDSFLKGATGSPRQIDMLPQEAEHFAGVGKQLARDAEMKRIASGINGAGSGNLASNEIAQIPNLLNRTAMVVNFMLKHVGGGANIPVAKEIAKRLGDPASFNELLLRPVGDPYRRVAESLMATSVGAVSQQQQGATP